MLLITGASGRIGRRVAELLANSRHELRLMCRDPKKAPKIENAQIVRGDYGQPDTLERVFEGASVALVVSGSGKPGERAEQHRNAFQAAAKAGVAHVIYLSLQGASPNSKYPYSRDHYLSEQYLAATGVPHTILRDAFYMDMFLEKFDGEGVIRGPAGDGRGAFVSREDVARTATAALANPSGGIHDITGPEAMSVREVVRRMSAITGRKLRYEPESVQSSRERVSKSERTSWRVDLAVGWFEAIEQGELEHVSESLASLTGGRPLTLEEYFNRFPKLLEPLMPDENSKH